MKRSYGSRGDDRRRFGTFGATSKVRKIDPATGEVIASQTLETRAGKAEHAPPVCVLYAGPLREDGTREVLGRSKW
jgi:hypothetical protein